MSKKSEIKATLEKMVAEQLEKRNGGQAPRSLEDILAASTPAPGHREPMKGASVSRILRALTAAKGDTERAYRLAKAHWGSKKDDVAGRMAIEAFEKANSAGDFGTGGFLIPEDMASDIIDLLRPRNVIRAAGAPTIPMPRGTLTLPKQTGDPSASYIGENQDITKSEPTGGHIVLSAKKLAALVPISNDLLLMDVGNQADMFIRDSIVRRIAIREDQAFIRDDGANNQPQGLRYWAEAGNVFGSAGTTATNVEDDLVTMMNNLEGNDVDMSNPVWFMSPRSKNHLVNLRDANGNLIYPTITNAQPTLYGFPVFVSNNIPNNLGGGTESEIYLVNVSDTIIAETGGLEVTADSTASYQEGGNLVSAFSRDQTVIRAIVRHDFAVVYPEAVTVMTGVTWGV